MTNELEIAVIMKAALFCSLLFHTSLVVWCSTESIIYNLQNVGCSFQDSLCLWRSKGATKNVRWKLSAHEENDIPYLNNGEQDFLFLYSENGSDGLDILWSPKFFTRNDLIYLTLNVYCAEDLDSFIVFYRYDDDKEFPLPEHFDIVCEQKYSWNNGQKVTIETGVNNETNHFRLTVSGYEPPLAISDIHLSEYIVSSSTLVMPTSGNNTSSQTTAGDREVNTTNDNVYTENTTLTTQTEKYSTLNSTSNNTPTEEKILTSSSSKQTEINTWSSARTNIKDREISTTTAPTNLGNTSYSMSTIQTSDSTTNALLTNATNEITSNLSLTTSKDELITSKPTFSTATDGDNLLNSTFIITTDKGYTSGSMVTDTSAEHNTSKSIFTASTNVYSTFNSTLATLVGENNTVPTISTPNDDNMSNGTSSELTNNIFSSTSAITQPITPTLTITTDGEYKNDSTYTARTDDYIRSTSTTIPTSTEHIISSAMSVTTSDDNKHTSPTTESIIEDSSSISTPETNTYPSLILLHTTRSSTKAITQTRMSSSVKTMSTSSETLSTKNSFISDMKESHTVSSVQQTIIGVFAVSWLSVFFIFLVKAGKGINRRRERWTVKESEIGDTVFKDVSSTPVVLRITSHNDG